MLLGQLDCTGDERVLRRSIDERCILEDTGNRKYSGGRYFLMAGFDGLHQIVCSVINPGNKVCIAFGVRSPLDDDFVQAMGSLEIPVEVRQCIAQGRSDLLNVLAELFNVCHGHFGPLKNVVCAIFLVCSNEVGVVDARERLHLRHLFLDHVL